MVGLWVSPAEAESGGSRDVWLVEAAAVLPGSTEGTVSGPGLAGLRTSAVDSAGTRRGQRLQSNQAGSPRPGLGVLGVGGGLWKCYVNYEEL